MTLGDIDWSVVLPLKDSVHTSLLELFLVILSMFFVSQQFQLLASSTVSQPLGEPSWSLVKC